MYCNKIKTLYCILFVLLFFANKVLSQEVTVKGIYQGENLYIQNPFSNNGVGFCVTKITVNGLETEDEIGSSAFEIELGVYGFSFGDSIKIAIAHTNGCKPKVLNFDAINPKSTFKIESINYNDKSKQLSWITTDERSALPFIVEQFRWRKWVQVAEVQGKGTESKHSYSAKVITYSGKNRFRIKQIDFSKKPRYSEECTYSSLSPKVSFSPAKPKTEITFSAITDYEIYNFYGQLITKGRGIKVDIRKLDEGDYFLNYDNSTCQFFKKQ